MTIAIAIIGAGKIARDQHIPTIADDDRFRLAGVVTRNARDLDLEVPVATDLSALKRAVPDLAAVAICTPPIDRLSLLREAFSLGLDVLMEKPPARTLGEAEHFAPLAHTMDRVLYQSWHSRCAGAVEPVRAWLGGCEIKHVTVDWLENVREWHPGQEWIWSPGVGVFDPGINALSILTHILPSAISVETSLLRFPANRAAPIEADLVLAADGHAIAMHLSFNQKVCQTWTITVETDRGTITLIDGGADWALNGTVQPQSDQRSEYSRVYDRFATLIADRRSEVDLRPFRLVADSFFLAERRQASDFHWADCRYFGFWPFRRDERADTRHHG